MAQGRYPLPANIPTSPKPVDQAQVASVITHIDLLTLPRGETEETPPIPAHLEGQECVYGYTVTDSLMDAYYAKNPTTTHPPSDTYLRDAYKHRTLKQVARQLGLKISIETNYGRDDIVYFADTLGGVIKVYQVPTAPRLERLANELGITEKAQWLDTGVSVRSYYRY
ncbi:hypothetical protein B0H11DRAFT_2219067 [Mycena galericulata]|nr:hypothetical protein B0H11DRAFT_2219067 [Mycena galericulata]